MIAPGDDVIVAAGNQRELRGRVLSTDGGWLKVAEYRTYRDGQLTYEPHRSNRELPSGNVWTCPWPWWEEPTLSQVGRLVRVELRSRMDAGLVPPKVW